MNTCNTAKKAQILAKESIELLGMYTLLQNNKMFNNIVFPKNAEDTCDDEEDDDCDEEHKLEGNKEEKVTKEVHNI